jgi:hypothetical protein
MSLIPDDNPLKLSDEFLAQLLDGLNRSQALVAEPLKTGSAFEAATQQRDALNNVKKTIDARRVEALKPLLAEQRRINGLADVLFDMIKPMIQTLDAARTAYRDESRRPVNVDPLPKPLAEAEGLPSSMAGSAGVAVSEPVKMRVRRVQRLKITDPARVPADFWMIDETKLKAALLSGVTVPGAELVIEEIPL